MNGENLNRSLNALAPNGRVAVISALEAFDHKLRVVPVFRSEATVDGISPGRADVLPG